MIVYVWYAIVSVICGTHPLCNFQNQLTKSIDVSFLFRLFLLLSQMCSIGAVWMNVKRRYPIIRRPVVIHVQHATIKSFQPPIWYRRWLMCCEHDWRKHHGAGMSSSLPPLPTIRSTNRAWSKQPAPARTRCHTHHPMQWSKIWWTAYRLVLINHTCMILPKIIPLILTQHRRRRIIKVSILFGTWIWFQ